MTQPPMKHPRLGGEKKTGAQGQPCVAAAGCWAGAAALGTAPRLADAPLRRSTVQTASRSSGRVRAAASPKCLQQPALP